SVVVVGRSINSRAPARMAFTITWGGFRMPIAKMAPSGMSSRSNSIPRNACTALSAGMSTRVTSGFAARTRRTTGSPVAMGKLLQVCTVRATLVPSTSTCKSARCSLSVATITTESSAIASRVFTAESISTSTSFETASNECAGACALFVALVELVLVQKWLWVFRAGQRLRTRTDAMHGAQNHQFGVVLLQAAAAEEVSQDRNIAKSRNLVVNVCNPIIHQAGNHEALAVLQFKFGFSPARTERGHR